MINELGAIMVIAGIDYSINSPAITVFDGDDWSFEKCYFYYITSIKKSHREEHPFFSTLYPEYESSQERHFNLTQWALDILSTHKVEKCFMEDYSYASTGRVFHLGENSGLLKHYLWKNDIPFDLIPPTVIKKFATNKGNSGKERLDEVFMEETKFNLKKYLTQTLKQWNPSSDIIDSYFIAKMGFVSLTNN